MTTIATDGKSMAGDGLCTGNGLVHGFDLRKIFRLADGRVVGMCGSAYNYGAFIDWLKDGGDKPSLTEAFEALVLSPDGTCASFNQHCQSMPQELPAVAGCGGAIALGAMLAGKSPRKAVEIASQRCQSTGGMIVVETL